MRFQNSIEMLSYRRIYAWSLILPPAPDNVRRGVSRFANKTLDVRRTRVVRIISSASYPLQLESRTIVEVVRSAESSGTVSSAKPNNPTRLPNPSL